MIEGVGELSDKAAPYFDYLHCVGAPVIPFCTLLTSNDCQEVGDRGPHPLVKAAAEFLFVKAVEI